MNGQVVAWGLWGLLFFVAFVWLVAAVVGTKAPERSQGRGRYWRAAHLSLTMDVDAVRRVSRRIP